MTDEKQKTDSELSRIAVKPPAFWINKPKLWFIQLEAQFSNSAITQDLTKYNTVVAALDENALDFVVDILSEPPNENKYGVLKNALLARLTDTEESRIRKLLTDIDLGDKRPSDLLRHMKSLAGSSISEEVIKSLWLQRLPQQAQAILSISKDSLDNIAEMADKIISVYNSTETFSIEKTGTTVTNSSAIENERIKALEASIASLTKKLEEFTYRNQSRSRSRNFRIRGSRTRSRSAEHKFCWYHYKFGENAKKCVQPCEFRSHNVSSHSEN